MWLYYWIAILFAQENTDFFSQLDRLERNSTLLKNRIHNLVLLFDYPPKQYPMLSIEKSMIELDDSMDLLQTQISQLEQNYEPIQ